MARVMASGTCEAFQKAFAADHGILAFIGLFADVGTFRDRDDGQPEMRGEAPIALIAAGHGHHRAGAIAAEHVIAHPHGHLLTREGMDARTHR
jgi:hypothetical protein